MWSPAGFQSCGGRPGRCAEGILSVGLHTPQRSYRERFSG